MYAGQARDNLEREELLVVTMRHEGPRSSEDPGWRTASTGIPHAIGLW